MTEPSRQQLKIARQTQDRAAFGVPPRMVRLGKRRPRAGLENQAPMSEWDRTMFYLRGRGTTTAGQRRRIEHKAGTARARARRAA